MILEQALTALIICIPLATYALASELLVWVPVYKRYKEAWPTKHRRSYYFSYNLPHSLLAAPLYEEAIFRAPILHFFDGWTAVLGLLLTSLPFTLIHLDRKNIGNLTWVSRLPAGFIFGLAGLITNNLWASISLHALWNLIWNIRRIVHGNILATKIMLYTKAKLFFMY